jgi:hypothetical protein
MILNCIIFFTHSENAKAAKFYSRALELLDIEENTNSTKRTRSKSDQESLKGSRAYRVDGILIYMNIYVCRSIDIKAIRIATYYRSRRGQLRWIG